jgi:pimeloyl-ACP methyl ester carboxylesterase
MVGRGADHGADSMLWRDGWTRVFPLFRPPPSNRRQIILAALASVVMILLAVTGTIIVTATVLPGTTMARQGSIGAVPPGLERFYSQDLSWGGCSAFAASLDDKDAYADPGLQCAYLTVPLDYANPNGRVIKVGLLRRPASDLQHRIGSLAINPGGPGASGMSAAARLAKVVERNDLGQRFDFVGFDPRGVGSSEPRVVCQTPAERDAERLMNLNVDTSPAGVARTESHEKAENAKCVEHTGIDVLAHVGTREVVRDIDVMRSALGDERLTYLGYSYGTRIGATYAEVFSGNVRAMVLDGAVDPAQDPVAHLLGQARGFQRAFDTFAAWCAARADCALGQDNRQAANNFQARVRPLITRPADVSDGRKLSYTDATIGTVQALYLPILWEPLNRGLRELAQGHGNILMLLADIYYGRETDGTYSTTMDAFQAVLCVDNPPIKDRNVARDVDAQYRKAAPFLDSGQPPSAALDNCAFWPVPPTGGPHRLQISGLPPVLVVSTTQDPATPYQAGVNLARELNGRVLTFEGTQHTVFLHGNSCVDQAGISYLISLQLPAEGTQCKAS